MELSIVIPTWNGRGLLARYLPSVLAECDRLAAAHGRFPEVIISDDGSTDGTAAWLAAAFPAVRCVSSPVNQGFGPAVNAGVAAAHGAIIALLNNDAELLPGALGPALPAFSDPALFGVTLRAEAPDGAFATGGKLGRFRRGFWEAWRNYDGWAGSSFALVGGFCVFRRDAFLALGGFDPLLAPYYWEDLDLSYRARKRGAEIRYLPHPAVRHEVSATIRRHRPAFARRAIIHRNRLLFHWKNLDPARLCWHLLWAHLMLVQLALKGDFAYHAGYMQALARWAAVRRFRRSERPCWRRGDASLAVTAPPPAAAPTAPTSVAAPAPPQAPV